MNKQFFKYIEIYLSLSFSPLSCSPLVSTLRHRLPLVRAPLTVEELSILAEAKVDVGMGVSDVGFFRITPWGFFTVDKGCQGHFTMKNSVQN